MPCGKTPSLTLPHLPAPLTTGPSIPSYNFTPGLCCKIRPSPIVTKPISFPPGTFNPTVVQIINDKISDLQQYFDGRPIKCPRE